MNDPMNKPKNPMEQQVSRQAEMDARHYDGINWRNTVRVEEKEWRERLRNQDLVWREKMRDEDLVWRQTGRDEEIGYHERSERTAKRCCALSAAVQSSKPGTAPDKIFELARAYEDWLNSQKD